VNPSDPERRRILARLGLGAQDFLIMSVVEDWPARGEAIIRRANRHNDIYYRPQLPPSRITEALSNLLSTGTLQKHTAESLLAHKSYVASHKQELYPGPAIEEFLRLGEIDFTKRGAILYRSCCEALIPGFDEEIVARFDLEEGQYLVCSCNREAIQQFVAECKSGAPSEKITRVSPPEHIGRWCDKWWRVFAEGWVVKVEYDTKCK